MDTSQTGNFFAFGNILPAHSNFPSAHFCKLAMPSPYLITFYIIYNTNFLKVHDFRHAVANFRMNLSVQETKFQSGTPPWIRMLT